MLWFLSLQFISCDQGSKITHKERCKSHKCRHVKTCTDIFQGFYGNAEVMKADMRLCVV